MSEQGPQLGQGAGQEAAARKRRRTEEGVVASGKMDKTIVVEVTRLKKHARYDKYLRSKTRFYAHDEKNEAKAGDRVEIAETRPLSKSKRWRLVRVLKRQEA